MDDGGHSDGDGQTEISIPLYGIPGDSNSNQNSIDFIVNHLIQSGVAPEKIVLDVRSYGRTFTLADPQNNGIGAATSGPGQAGEYTQESGMLAFYEICALKESWLMVQVNEYARYAYKDKQWVGYDTVNAIYKIIEYVISKNLGGGMFRFIDTDDIPDFCGCGKYPLLTAFSQKSHGIESTTSQCVKDKFAN